MPLHSSGVEELQKQLQRLQRIEQNTSIAEEALKVGADILKREIEKRAPRGTHAGKHIADHVILGKIFSNSIDVGFHKDFFYAHFLEYGTINMAAQPFIEPAYNACRKEIIQAMMAVYQRELNKL
jgi:HK97 gp10 family phage protein